MFASTQSNLCVPSAGHRPCLPGRAPLLRGAGDWPCPLVYRSADRCGARRVSPSG